MTMSGAKKVLLFMMFIILSCSQVSAKSKYRLKFATMAPKAIGWSMPIRDIFMPALKKATDGKVSIKWYWGGIKGDDIDYVRLMKEGKLDGAALAGQGVIMVCPEMSVLSLPFLFQSFDEVDYVRRHMFSRFNELAKKQGFQLLSWGDIDFDQIYTTTRPIRTINDFQHITITGWYNTPIDRLLTKRLRTDYMPVRTFEKNSVLRQRKANAYIGPAFWVVSCQLYTLFQYIIPLKMRYSPAALVLSRESWNKIPEKYHSRIKSILQTKRREFCEKARIDTSRTLMAMKNFGLKTIHVSPDETSTIKKICRSIWAETTNKVFPESIFNELQGHLQRYRKLNN